MIQILQSHVVGAKTNDYITRAGGVSGDVYIYTMSYIMKVDVLSCSCFVVLVCEKRLNSS